jgi:hypothetical protein
MFTTTAALPEAIRVARPTPRHFWLAVGGACAVHVLLLLGAPQANNARVLVEALLRTGRKLTRNRFAHKVRSPHASYVDYRLAED